MRLFTTRWVLVEVADAMAAPGIRRTAAQFLQVAANSSWLTVLGETDDLFDQGSALFAARPDKRWSLTDCISFKAMMAQGLTEVLTGDHHFEQAGFVALLR